MIYRQARLPDAAPLAAIEALQPRCAQWGQAGWCSELQTAAAYVCCAQEAQEVVGFVALRLAAGTGEILNVGVHPRWCKRGIGGQLVARALAWAKQHGGQEITLEVAAGNTAAQALYRRAGFHTVGVRKKFYHGQEDALIMGICLCG